MNKKDNNQEEINSKETILEDKVEMEDDEEKLNYRKILPYFLLFVTLLFFSVFGITYSIYKGDESNDNEIITDQIIFSYSDVDKAGSGINIVDAIPISDEIGKKMTGKNQYFDFYITASTKKSKVSYQILVNKNSGSNLSNKDVRIYLTKLQGSYEQPLVLTDYSTLKSKTMNHRNYDILYTKILSENLENYTDSYRLRMWVREDAKNYEDKMFSVKIDVFASQLED